MAAPRSKLIPIYDETAPIVCTLTDEERPARIAVIERLRTAASSADRTPTGLLLHFPDDRAIRRDLATFAIDEKRCCQFWGFAIDEEPDGVALRWDGPPEADVLLDRLHTFFTGDATIDVLDGLL